MSNENVTVDELREKALARMADLRAEIGAIRAKTADKRALLEQLAAENAMLTARMNALAAEIQSIEQPRVFDLKRELGKLARMAGGY